MYLNERLDFFSNMIRCCHNLYLWKFDPAFQIVSSNCPEEKSIGNFLNPEGLRDLILDYADENDMPLIVSSSIHLMWSAAFEKNEQGLKNIYLLGPFFIDDNSPQNIEARLRQMELSASLHRSMVSFLHSLPVISLNRIMEYGIMLHYAVTGETVSVSDLSYRDTDNKRAVSSEQAASQPMIHGSYEAEQEMLRMVREGDLNFEKKKQKLSLAGNIGRLSNSNDGRQFKNAVLVCVVLFSRAAIEGGLAPEVSMTLTDHYFQSVEACGSIQELKDISSTMQMDFIRRVHRCRQNSSYSKTVRNCCDYIDLHLEDPISLAALAEKMGYTEYYLTRKFRQETGRTMKDYIREKRIERAKFLLNSTDMNIHDISMCLQFSSQSYFTEIFRKTTGMHPTAFRERSRSLP